MYRDDSGDVTGGEPVRPSGDWRGSGHSDESEMGWSGRQESED